MIICNLNRQFDFDNIYNIYEIIKIFKDSKYKWIFIYYIFIGVFNQSFN